MFTRSPRSATEGNLDEGETGCSGGLEVYSDRKWTIITWPRQNRDLAQRTLNESIADLEYSLSPDVSSTAGAPGWATG
jgi:hypothetical protein